MPTINDYIKALWNLFNQEDFTDGFRKMVHHLRLMTKETWNHKRIYRLTMGFGLNLPEESQMKRAKTSHLPATVDCHITWSADFMHDILFCGKSFRVFNVMDDYREELLCSMDKSLNSEQIIQEWDALIQW